MEQNLKIHNRHSIWPQTVLVVAKGLPDEHKTINSEAEFNSLLEEVKLYNSENEIQKRIISI